MTVETFEAKRSKLTLFGGGFPVSFSGSFLELKEVLEAVEPNKKANDVAEFFYRAFNMPSVEEATAMLSPEDEDQVHFWIEFIHK
jgi:hypothetical protein